LQLYVIDKKAEGNIYAFSLFTFYHPGGIALRDSTGQADFHGISTDTKKQKIQ